MTPTFFKNQFEFRKWLEENHSTSTELLVGFYKVGSEKHNMTWSQSVDQALCYGWIDGVRKSIDNESYCIRFTPRRITSIWSPININKIESLIEQGLMQPLGLAAYGFRTEEKSKIYTDDKELTDSFVSKFKMNMQAWEFFTKQSMSYKKAVIHWIMTAKQEVTQVSRLEKAISESENGIRLWDKYK